MIQLAWFVFDFIITLWQIQVFSMALIFFFLIFIFFSFFFVIEIPAHDTAHCMHSQYRFNAECDF